MTKNTHKADTTYTRLTIKIIVLLLVFTLVSSYIYSEYIKKDAVENLAHVDAKKTSLLVFEAIYVAMSNGMNKDRLDDVIRRINSINDKLHVDVYRSRYVNELFGEETTEIVGTEDEIYLKKAMSGEEVLNINDKKGVEYFYPVHAKQECLKCHVNAKEGEVLGVINVSYPLDELKVSLYEMINFFILFVIIFSFIVFSAIFFNFNRYLLRPIKDFVSLIDSIKRSKDIKKRVNVTDNIKEIKSMQTVFNEMLDSIENHFYNDELTGLKNRRSLIEALDKNDESMLMIMNIDRFQEVNNLYGAECGDTLLIEFAEYLCTLLQDEDDIYRLHADEFAYISSGAMGIEEFEELAGFIITSVSQKRFAIVNNEEINITVTMGISFGVTQLLPNADIALKLAKKQKKPQLTYNDSMQAMQKYEQNFNWSKKLNKAIEEDRVVPLFQPIAECESGEIVKYECLMRIEDDNKEYISPFHFLDLAKKNKIYHKLTKAIIRKSFEAFRHSSKSFSINISIDDIMSDEIREYLLESLKQGEIAKRAIVEITESEGIEEFGEVSKFIESVKKYGGRVSIDDFGTGYSNFEYLMKLNIDYIKIDGSLIKNIDTDQNSKMITQTIVEFAKKIGVETVAEFVYSKIIFDIVKEIGVDYAQGYYFGQPSKEIR